MSFLDWGIFLIISFVALAPGVVIINDHSFKLVNRLTLISFHTPVILQKKLVTFYSPVSQEGGGLGLKLLQ